MDGPKEVSDVQENGPGNVIPLKGKQAGALPAEDIDPPTKPKGKKKLSPLELVTAFGDALDKRSFAFKPPFEHTFHVITDPLGYRQLVEELPGEVLQLRADEHLEDLLLTYSRVIPADPSRAPVDLLPALAAQIVRTWKARQAPLDEDLIAPVRQLSTPGKCWHRLPWDLASGETPAFDEMMARTTGAEALMSWVGSLLDADADRQQYVWIWGAGQNGKGSLARFLRKVFGPSYRAEVVPDRPDKFWTSGLVGARLVVFADCEEYRFPGSGIFKSLTGEDAVRIERKGQASTTTTLCCKFLFLSNDRPLLTSGKSDMRRAIYCEMAPLKDGTEPLATRAYDKMLWDEGPAFLAKCRAVYERHRLRSGKVMVDAESLDAVIAASEEQWSDMFDRHFELHEEGYVLPCDIVALMRDMRVQNSDIKRFYSYLERAHDIRRVCVRPKDRKVTDAEREWRYCGMKWRREVWKEMQAKLKGPDPKF